MGIARLKNLLFLLTVMVLLSGCHSSLLDACDDRVVREVRSGDGKFVATLYVRNCGATTDYSSIVNLRPGGTRFNGYADDYIIFVAKGERDIGIQWLNTNEVRVWCRGCESNDIFKKQPTWKDVKIAY